MRVYLAIAAEDPSAPIPGTVLSAIRAVAHEAIPVPEKEIRAWEWRSDDDGTALLAWGNEPDHPLLPPPLTVRHDRALGHCGYLADPAEDERLLAAPAMERVAAGLGGCFSLFRAGPEGFTAVTSITRVCPVYHADAGGLRLAGSRALLVHLAARTARTGQARPEVDLDVPALQPMVRHGFFTNDETPFAGVRALPNAATLTARRGRGTQITQDPFPETRPAPRSPREVDELVSATADALLAAVRPLARYGEPTRLALSGGRDSRLLAAVLHAAGVPFHARTRGFADDPDVLLATRIARELGIEHQVDLTTEGSRPESVEVPHPLDRAVRVIRMCEGMTSAYEQVNGWAPYTLEPRVSGSGGETLRGGFLYDQTDLRLRAVRRRVRTIFLSGEVFLTPESNARARADHEKWDARAQENPYGTLDELYLRYRTGRWIVGSHTATLMNTPYHHPFFDNRVVREVLALPAEWRWSEELVFGLIERLAPRLRDIPPEGKRWRFESRRPRRWGERKIWRERDAVRPTAGRTSGFNWRKSYDENFLALLREQVMDGPRELFDLVDEAKAREHFAHVPQGWTNQTWHIYTLSVLLSGTWRQGAPDLPRVRIPIPTSRSARNAGSPPGRR